MTGIHRPLGRRWFALVSALAAAIAIAPALLAAAAEFGGAFKAGPNASGDNTYIGSLEAPKQGVEIKSGADMAVTGWALDTTAQGWAGFDQMTVYDNPIDQGGTKLADGTVGLPRPDVAAMLGGPSANSGFSAVVPSETLSAMKPGPMNVYVYLHTPHKGWWYQQSSVKLDAPRPDLQYPNDPQVVITRPQVGDNVSQSQKLKQNDNRLKILGWALDRNPVIDPNSQNLGPANSGVCRVQLYLDGPRGTGTLLAPSANLSQEILAANAQPNGTPVQQGSGRHSVAYPPGEFGAQYNLAGWRWDVNPTTLSLGPHTVYAYARGCITGRESMTSTSFTVTDIGINHT
ncbi:MAG: hypothetical protein JO023_24065 [Chloroflexi bacterium]|nr:hypothetical protein [Chloroflexota bacterium]